MGTKDTAFAWQERRAVIVGRGTTRNARERKKERASLITETQERRETNWGGRAVLPWTQGRANLAGV